MLGPKLEKEPDSNPTVETFNVEQGPQDSFNITSKAGIAGLPGLKLEEFVKKRINVQLVDQSDLKKKPFKKRRKAVDEEKAIDKQLKLLMTNSSYA